MASIIVSRIHTSGNITFGIYLVDLFCKGVKDSGWYFNQPNAKLYQYLENQYLMEVDYQLVHNIIYEGVAFAEDCGFDPHPDFQIATYILNSDDGTIEDIEIECGGEDGQPFLMEYDSLQFQKDYRILKNTLGEGNFDFAEIDKSD